MPSATSNSQFQVKLDHGAIVSLKPCSTNSDLDFLPSGRRLGDLVIKYRHPGEDWQSFQTSTPSPPTNAILSSNGTEYSCQLSDGQPPTLALKTTFTFQPESLLWSFSLSNLTSKPLEIGDLALPLPVGLRNRRQNDSSRSDSPRSPVILKHSFISGDASFIFWMPSTSKGPYLVMTPLPNTSFEYWDANIMQGGFRAYIHSAAAGAIAKEHGTQWRQPNTSLTLAPHGQTGDSQTCGVKFRWADNYDGVRQVLVDEGGIDTQVVPGMTVPSDLFAEIALRTKQKVNSIEPEFPQQTSIEALGSKAGSHVYKVKFSRLGENKLTVRYGDGRHMLLEFFCTEPVETLVRKRAAFIAAHQVHDTNKWYNGLFCDWNMESQVQVTPDNYDRLRGFRIYAATCDDAGLGHPAYLAAKSAEYPDQAEVEALDYYIRNFVWGGLQRATNESYAYGIYGIPDWKKNRDSKDPGRNGQLHLYREYDYPHVILMYFSMYRIAKYHPEIKMAMTADQYLRGAYGTAFAMFTVPHEVWNGWSPYGTGFYNEVVLPDLIDALGANGWTDETKTLRGFWERKVKNFVNGDEDLFRSEYAFDSTGFESTHAFAKYAMLHADIPGAPEKSGIALSAAQTFLDRQLAANIFCRGWLEPAYYYLGSDYRGGAGNAYTLSYMAQMGGWSVLDYSLNFANEPAPYLRLGYASILSSWALVNSGTPDSKYGYWFPGEANDGGAGGGFEPAPFGQTWLGQAHHRGSWYYACEIDLGFCGALRAAATVLADDPIFGRFCFGGDWRQSGDSLEVVPKDGLRRRFHVMLGTNKLHLISDTDHFAAAQPLVLKNDLSQFQFQLESSNPEKHLATIHVSGLTGAYTISSHKSKLADLSLKAGEDKLLELPLEPGAQPQTFVIARSQKIAEK